MILFTSSPTNNIRDMGAIWTKNKPWIQGFKKGIRTYAESGSPVTRLLGPSVMQKEVSEANSHFEGTKDSTIS
ncbi:MAG: hypothetical protein ACREBS_11520 [Nitrososphaerales archaeon]